MLPGVRHDYGDDLLSERLVGDAERDRLEDRRVRQEHVLELPRVDAVAAPEDHVLLAIDEEEVAVLVQVAHVPGREPTSPDGRPRLGGFSPVALHEAGSTQDDLPDLAPGDLVATRRRGVGAPCRRPACRRSRACTAGRRGESPRCRPSRSCRSPRGTRSRTGPRMHATYPAPATRPPRVRLSAAATPPPCRQPGAARCTWSARRGGRSCPSGASRRVRPGVETAHHATQAPTRWPGS